MEKFNDKYRIPSTRLLNWNYGSPALYFVTIITQSRKHYFGEIENGILKLNKLGLYAFSEWEKSPMIRPDMNIQLGEFVVMPNHFHGIVMIGENEYNTGFHGSGFYNGYGVCRDAMHCVSTDDDVRPKEKDAMHGVSTDAGNNGKRFSKNKFGPQSKNIGSIIRGFKSSVTTYARKNKIVFDWQERFYDRVIRNHDEYLRISNYIKNNPANWRSSL
jgi:putative transposase